MSNRAWVTLATNDSYGLGALVLAHSLRRVSSAYPAVVLITPSVTEAMRERLRAVFAEVIIVDVLDSGDATHLALLQRPELGITFTKIHCWNLIQYEKCVFLDADTLVVQNSDELFEREELSAAPDVGWPDCFNSGVFVFVPSAETFSRLVTFAQDRGSFDGGDQGLLNSFFSDWARGDINKHLPFLYNVTSAAFYSYIPALKHYGQDLKIIHFIGAGKPWLQRYNFESRTVDAPQHIQGFLQLWWDLFVSQVHTQLDTTMSGVAGNLARVVPGATSFEALDDLSRRQGWEAGNIDYMGADSFDKIWAKISQTLSTPKQPSPPKEPSPPAPVEVKVQETEVVQEPVSEPIEVAKEAAAVEALAPAPVEVAAPAAPVESPAPAASEEAPAAPEEAPAAPLDAIIVKEPVIPKDTVQEVAPTPAAALKAAAPVSADIPATIEPTPTPVALKEADLAEIPVTVTAIEEPKEKTEVAPEVKEAAPVAIAPKVVEAPTLAEASPTPAAEAPSSPVKETPAPAKPTDSPPLANTPSAEEAPAVPAAKSEERRKPAGKLQLRPPAAADPLPTPDSELEDAASLAQSIIASELRTPTVHSPASPAAPASPPAPVKKGLTVEEPEVPTPPVGAGGAVSLAQIGVKPKEKTTTAARIESSVAAAAPGSPVSSASPAADPPKKKLVKKVVKKDVSAAGGEAPVPPPRKKEKKPKEK